MKKFKYNEYLTFPDCMPTDCKSVLGIWSPSANKTSYKPSYAYDLLIWENKKGELQGYYIGQYVEKVYGWPISPGIDTLPTTPPDIWNPETGTIARPPTGVCICDIQQLFNMGHDLDCPERKK